MTSVGLPPGWQDWLMVFGYISFLLFIVWRVLASSK